MFSTVPLGATVDDGMIARQHNALCPAPVVALYANIVGELSGL